MESSEAFVSTTVHSRLATNPAYIYGHMLRIDPCAKSHHIRQWARTEFRATCKALRNKIHIASASSMVLLPEKFQHLWYRRNTPFPHPNYRLVLHHQRSTVFELRKTPIGLASVEIRRSLPFHHHPSRFDSLCRGPLMFDILIKHYSPTMSIVASGLQRAVWQLDKKSIYPIEIPYLP